MARETDCRPVFRSALRRRVESNLDGSASKREVSWLAAADRADSAAGVVFVRPSSSAGWVVAVGCTELNADDPEAVVAGAVGWVSCPLVWAGAVGCEAGLVFLWGRFGLGRGWFRWLRGRGGAFRFCRRLGCCPWGGGHRYRS